MDLSIFLGMIATYFIFIIFLLALNGFVCRYIAKKRGSQSTMLWFFAGFFTGFLALVAVWASGPSRDEMLERVAKKLADQQARQSVAFGS